ncbi:MAG: polysaccharide deacetylase family protein [Mycoplasmatales bacterium]
MKIRKILLFCTVLLFIFGFIFNINNTNKFNDLKTKAGDLKIDTTMYNPGFIVTNEEINTLTAQINIFIQKQKDEEQLQKDIANNQNGVPILMYHFFSPSGQTPPDGNWISIGTFESHLQMFKDNNVNPITVEQYNGWFQGTGAIPKNSVLITIDDGQPGTYELAAPMLEKYGYSAVSFEITSKWDSYDTKKQVKSLELHSHTNDMHQGICNGTSKSGMMQCVDVEEGIKDLKTAKSIINPEDYFFCYPFGGYEGVAKDVLRGAGYKYAVTVDHGVSKRDMDPLELPRIRVSSNTTAETLKEFVLNN